MTRTITILLLRRRSFTHSLRCRACRMADNNGDDDGDDFPNHAVDKDAGSMNKMPGQQPRSFPAIRYHDPTFNKPPHFPPTVAVHLVHIGSQGDSSGPPGSHWQPGRQQRSTWLPVYTGRRVFPCCSPSGHSTRTS